MKCVCVVWPQELLVPSKYHKLITNLRTTNKFIATMQKEKEKEDDKIKIK